MDVSPSWPGRTWLALAVQPPVVQRGLVIAAVVGTLLTLINHGDAIIDWRIDSIRIMKIGLTYLVPYGVSTFSSIAAMRGAVSHCEEAVKSCHETEVQQQVQPKRN